MSMSRSANLARGMWRAFVLLWMVTAGQTMALTLHVAPDGADGNAGTRREPLASMAGARDRVRELRRQLPGEPVARVTDLRSRSANFKKLDWLGFCSMATQKTAFYLDDLYLGPER